MLDKAVLTEYEKRVYDASMYRVAEDSVFTLSGLQFVEYGLEIERLSVYNDDKCFDNKDVYLIPTLLENLKFNESEDYKKLHFGIVNKLKDSNKGLQLFLKLMMYADKNDYESIKKEIFLYNPLVWRYEKIEELNVDRYTTESHYLRWFENQFGKNAIIPYPIIFNRLYDEGRFQLLNALIFSFIENIIKKDSYPNLKNMFRLFNSYLCFNIHGEDEYIDTGIVELYKQIKES